MFFYFASFILELNLNIAFSRDIAWYSVCLLTACYIFKNALFYQAEHYKREMSWKMKTFCMFLGNRQNSDVEASRLSKVSLWYKTSKVQNVSHVYTIIQYYSPSCNALHYKKQRMRLTCHSWYERRGLSSCDPAFIKEFLLTLLFRENIFASPFHSQLGHARRGSSLRVQLFSISNSQTSCERNLRTRVGNEEPGMLSTARTDTGRTDRQ